MKFKFLALLVVLLFSGLVFGAYTVKIDGGNYDFAYRRTVTIQSGQVQGGPHGDFPMLFDSKTDAGLQADLVSAAGKVESPDGYDIVFATGEGVEIFKHEIEKYVASTGEYVAWIKIPNPPGLSDGTQFYLYYGSTDITDENPDKDSQHALDVWDDNYMAVWHLNETVIDEQTTGTHYNSCSADNNGSQNGNASTTGRIAGGQDIELDDYIEVPDHSSIDFGLNQDFTISLWMNSSQWPDPGVEIWPYVLSKDNQSSPRYGYNMFTMDGNPDEGYWCEWSYFKVYSSGASTSVVMSESGLVDGNWHYIAAKRDGVNLYSYFDGNYSGNTDSDGGANHSNDVALRMGTNIDDDWYFQYEGLIDEVRISKIARTDDWIKTEYNNQKEVGWNFYAVGGEQTLIKLSYFKAKPLNSRVVLEWATETELDNEGFNILRCEEEDGEYVKINPYLIPARGSAGFGAEYSYTDYDVENRVKYYYLLEDMDFYGKRTLHGPVSATPNDIILIWPIDWEPLPSGASLFSWTSSGNFFFKVDVSSNPSFPNSEILTFPEEGWLSALSLWLRPEEWEMILKRAHGSEGQLFWRIRAKSQDGRVICSDWKKFEIDF